tara:strand:+ start:440 stop:691 length:252 start_codon:yes stop_codon:yes gene_type:complete
MSRFLIISLLFLASCSGSVRVNKTVPKHGAVPELNPVRADGISVDRFSSTAFLVFYTPILLGSAYLTYRTFKKTKESKQQTTA